MKKILFLLSLLFITWTSVVTVQAAPATDNDLSMDVSVTHQYQNKDNNIDKVTAVSRVDLNRPNEYSRFIRPKHNDKEYQIDSFTVLRVPKPRKYPFRVNYYKDSIGSENLLGSISGEGLLNDHIPADLYRFAPEEYNTPGIRSGKEHITEEENIVNVLYDKSTPVSPIRYVIEYYFDGLGPDDLYETEIVEGITPGTLVTLTDLQLTKYSDEFSWYEKGVQVGGPVAVTEDLQIIKVLYLEKTIYTVRINHYTETAFQSGDFQLYQSTDIIAYENTVINSMEYMIFPGGNYHFAFASPQFLTVSANESENIIDLHYTINFTRSLALFGNTPPDNTIVRMDGEGGKEKTYTIRPGNRMVFSENYDYYITIRYSEQKNVPVTEDGTAHGLIYLLSGGLALFVIILGKRSFG